MICFHCNGDIESIPHIVYFKSSNMKSQGCEGYRILIDNRSKQDGEKYERDSIRNVRIKKPEDVIPTVFHQN